MKINLKHTQIELRNDGIVEIQGSDIDYTVNHLKDTNKALSEMFKGVKKRLLILPSDFSNMEKEAREYMALPESTQYAIAQAFVVRSLGQRILANFYMMFNKPNVPVRVFDSKHLAEMWLLEFI